LEERVAVVPGAQVVDADLEALGQRGVELGLGGAEGRVGRLLERVEEREQPALVDLRERQPALVGVAEALLARGLVAQAHHLSRALLGRAPDLLGRFPDRPGPRRVGRLGERVVELVLRPLAAIEVGPEAVEEPLLLGAEPHQLVADRRLLLSAEVVAPEVVDLAGDQRILAAGAGVPPAAEPGEALAVAVVLAPPQRQLANALLQLGIAGQGEVPLGLAGLGPEAALEGVLLSQEGRDVVSWQLPPPWRDAPW